MTADLDRALRGSVDAVREAGALVRADFHRPSGARGRGDHAPVDTEAEVVIRSRLLSAFPDWGYRGEETGTGGLDPPPRFVWLVDPNDGTRSYLQGYRGSSVSVALLRDGEPVLGVVYAPCALDADGDLIAWAEGCGPVTRNGQPVEQAPWPQRLGPHDIILVAQDADRMPAVNLRLTDPARYRAMTSIAYRLALSAVGEAEVGTSFKGAGDWDYAGGHALLRAVGGELFDQDGRAVRYSPRGESRGRACFGGAPEVVGDLVGRPWKAVHGTPERASDFPDELRPVRLAPGRVIADAGLLRRAQGCLLGQLAGDALGAPVEGQTCAAIAQRHPHGLRSLVDGGTWGTMAGQPTDDSELALALARSLVARGRYAADVVAGAYGYWYQSGPFSMGTATQRALRAAAAAIGTRRTHASGNAVQEPKGSLPSLQSAAVGRPADAAMRAADRDSQANGSLMRISPLGIWGHGADPDTLARWAREESCLTHPNPVCQEACAVFVVTLAHAVRTGASPRETYGFARRFAERRCQSLAVVEALAAADGAPPADFVSQSGWVLVAFQNAFFQLLHAPSLEDGIVATVMAGGDTDTNAAIAGALFGAVHGREGVPLRWRRLILSCRPVRGAPGVAQPRPQPFWPVDALELAERLLVAGGA